MFDATQHSGRTRDHPREYGENLSKVESSESDNGSSPRIRGEYLFGRLYGARTRIIPANTGRIQRKGLGWFCGWDHPREYGENEYYTRNNIHGVGSSPRIRGEFESVWADCVFHGIIPANTGRMTHPTRFPLHRGDHPREYGENGNADSPARVYYGSSPRIRGEYRVEQRKHVSVGIIPANTGRIISIPPDVQPFADHPREYGENVQ